MLEKDPASRITASESLNHPWILGIGKEGSHKDEKNVKVQQTQPQQVQQQQKQPEHTVNEKETEILHSAQENMKKFQDERFNVKNIKPQDLVMNTPLITGRTLAVEGGNPNQLQSPVMPALTKKTFGQAKNMADMGFNKILPTKRENKNTGLPIIQDIEQKEKKKKWFR